MWQVEIKVRLPLESGVRARGLSMCAAPQPPAKVFALRENLAKRAQRRKEPELCDVTDGGDGGEGGGGNGGSGRSGGEGGGGGEDGSPG